MLLMVSNHEVFGTSVMLFPSSSSVCTFLSTFLFCASYLCSSDQFLLGAFSDQPVHLYDAYTGDVRATYRSFNALDEMESPAVVEFSDDGQKILCSGFRTDRTIHIFETAIPGRESTILRLGKTRRSSDGQKGLVSAVSFGGTANKQLFAVGTYAPGSIYVYDFRAGQQATGTILSGLCVVGHGRGHSRKKRRFVSLSADKHDDNDGSDGEANENENWLSAAKVKWFQSRAQGGVTQLKFAPNEGHILYSASRRSNAIIAWDLRMLSGNPDHQSNPVRGLASYETKSDTNQRLEFDIDASGQTLYVGGQDSCVRVYDLSSGKLNYRLLLDGLDDAVNGVSHTYQNGSSLLAVATGSRRFLSDEDLDHDHDHANVVPSSTFEPPPGNLRLYKLTGCY
jgi:WD40 repeat protein